MTGMWWLRAALSCGAFLAGTYAVWRYGRTEEAEPSRSGGRPLLPVLLAASLLLRVWLALTSKGHPIDVGTFSAWAGHAGEGLTAFYSPGYFADYPPGYIYVLWAVGKLRLLFGLDFGTAGFLLLLKLPPILSDVAAIWVLYRVAARRWSPEASLVIAALYAFNPMVILDSAVWGQVDGVLTLFLLLGVVLLEERPALSGACFAAALLAKPQALIFTPVPLLWFGVRLVRGADRETWAELLSFAGAWLLVFSLGVLPFAAREDVGWIVRKYAGTLASYPYASFNAYSFFALIGGNLAPVGERLLFLPYSAWGTLFIVGIVVLTAWVGLRGKDPSRFWYIALFLAASVFVFSAKMHERYLFPALALALGFFAVVRDGRALALYAGFTVTLFLNTAQVLALSYRELYAVPRLDPLLLVGSLANVVLWAVLAWLGYDRYLTGRTQPTPE